MRARRANTKGRPLRAAGVFFAFWIAARLALWESPFVQVVAAMPRHLAEVVTVAAPPSRVATTARSTQLVQVVPRRSPAPSNSPSPSVAQALAEKWVIPAAQSAKLVDDAAGQTVASSWPGLASPGAGTASRWSGDAWLLWRDSLGPVRAQQGFIAPAYGARQVGAVLRYRLAPGSSREPTLYLRGTRALERAHENEVALGLSVRPLKALPVVLGAELRGGDVGGSVKLRPALLAVSQLPPVQVPLLGRAEAYLQGGYVGGPFATPFADGQLRVTRRLIELGSVELRAGGGAWGGAQRGASRLDVGPTADLALPLGPVTTRLSADWRFRVAGDAIPGSGPAITLSAGF